MYKREIGDKIRKLRLQKGLNQAELSEKAQLTLRSIQRLEKGDNSPREDTLLRISTALDVNINEFRDQEKYADKGFLLILAISPIGFLIHPLLAFIPPLLLWFFGKDKLMEANRQGKQIVIFELTWLIIYYTSVFLIMGGIFFQIKSQGQIDASRIGNQVILVMGVKIALYALNIIFIIWTSLRINRNLPLSGRTAIPFFNQNGSSKYLWIPLSLVLLFGIWKIVPKPVKPVTSEFNKEQIIDFSQNIIEIPFGEDFSHSDTLLKYLDPTIDSTRRAMIMHGMFIPWGNLPDGSYVIKDYGKCIKNNLVTHMVHLQVNVQGWQRYILNIVEKSEGLLISYYFHEELSKSLFQGVKLIKKDSIFSNQDDYSLMKRSLILNSQPKPHPMLIL